VKIIVIEGIGDIVSKPNGYGPALQKLKIDIPSLRIVFCDLEKEWEGKTAENRRKTVEWLRHWGGEFIDKSAGDKSGYESLLNEEVDAVIIATPDRTHVGLAKYWLRGNCKRIFIEKPLTSQLAEAQRWLTEDLYNKPEDYERVLAFDHYRPRVHERLCHKDLLWVILNEIGRLKRFTFYFLEDHSGTDERWLKAVRRERGIVDRNGPVENEDRVGALQSGLVMDLMPHVLAVLEYFGDPATVKLREIRPAIYTGVDYEEDARAEIGSETFAAIKFSFRDDVEGEVEGAAYVGKGILGTIRYPDLNGNVKVLELEGDNGNKAEINFSQGEIHIVKTQTKVFFSHLERDPYYYLLRDIAFTRTKGATVSISVETATIILEKLTEMKAKIDVEKLKTYRLGDKSGRLPPLLESLLEGGESEIPPIRAS
jgi:predicted dehydrogenase